VEAQMFADKRPDEVEPVVVTWAFPELERLPRVLTGLAQIGRAQLIEEWVGAALVD
jgi:hypothetical protein